LAPAEETKVPGGRAVSGFGTLRWEAEGPAVRFERRYEAGPAELRGAWTRPERISRWLDAEVVGALEVEDSAGWADRFAELLPAYQERLTAAG
jgi:hypothetical protein